MKKWSGTDLVQLLTQKHQELIGKYGLSYSQVAYYKHQYKSLLIQELNDIKEYLMEKEPENTEKQELVDRLLKALEENDISIETVGEIERLRVGSYQVVTKDSDGEAQIHNLSAINATFSPKMAQEQDFVRQAKPTRIYPIKSKPRNAKEELVVIIPDSQHGFRRYEDGSYEPMHDEQACDVALQLVKHLNPDKIVMGGDHLDLAPFGKFEKENSFMDTTQRSIDSLHEFLSKLRANAPDAKMIYLAGNHESRLTKRIQEYNGELLGLRRANASHELGVLALPFLLRLDELDVEYHEAYPANRYFLNENLQVIHGTKAKQSGRTAADIVRNEHISTIFNHTHRRESAERTVNARDGRLYAKIIVAASYGTLARIDGAVPSYGSGINYDQKPEESYENWQQGIGIATLLKTGAFALNAVAIEPDTHEAYFDGKIYKPNER